MSRVAAVMTSGAQPGGLTGVPEAHGRQRYEGLTFDFMVERARHEMRHGSSLAPAHSTTRRHATPHFGRTRNFFAQVPVLIESVFGFLWRAHALLQLQ